MQKSKRNLNKNVLKVLNAMRLKPIDEVNGVFNNNGKILRSVLFKHKELVITKEI